MQIRCPNCPAVLVSARGECPECGWHKKTAQKASRAPPAPSKTIIRGPLYSGKPYLDKENAEWARKVGEALKLDPAARKAALENLSRTAPAETLAPAEAPTVGKK